MADRERRANDKPRTSLIANAEGIVWNWPKRKFGSVTGEGKKQPVSDIRHVSTVVPSGNYPQCRQTQTQTHKHKHRHAHTHTDMHTHTHTDMHTHTNTHEPLRLEWPSLFLVGVSTKRWTS